MEVEEKKGEEVLKGAVVNEDYLKRHGPRRNSYLITARLIMAASHTDSVGCGKSDPRLAGVKSPPLNNYTQIYCES